MAEIDYIGRLKQLEEEVNSLRETLKQSDEVRNSLFTLLIVELSNARNIINSNLKSSLLNSSSNKSLINNFQSADSYIKQIVSSDYSKVCEQLNLPVNNSNFQKAKVIVNSASKTTKYLDMLRKPKNYKNRNSSEIDLKLDIRGNQVSLNQLNQIDTGEIEVNSIDTKSKLQIVETNLRNSNSSSIEQKYYLNGKPSWLSRQIDGANKQNVELLLEPKSNDWFCFVCNSDVTDGTIGDHFCFTKVSRGVVCNYCGKCTSRMPDLRVHFRKIVYCKLLRKNLKKEYKDVIKQRLSKDSQEINNLLVEETKIT